MSASAGDQKLWAAYATKAAQFFGSGASQTSPTFLAPVTSSGIAAGQRIPQAITNQGLFVLADTMPDPTSPVFHVGDASYFQQVYQYLLNVQMPGDQNDGPHVRLLNAQGTLSTAEANQLTQLTSAMTMYNQLFADGLVTNSFAIWLNNGGFPAYSSAVTQVQSDSIAVEQALAAINGAEAPLLSQDLINCQTANNASAAAETPGITMSCSQAPANDLGPIVNGGTPPQLPARLRPDYTIDASYPSKVDGWIQAFPTNKSSPTTISFSVADATGNDFAQYGFNSQSVNASTSDWIFFSATYTENGQTKTEFVNASSTADEVSVTISMTNFGQFPIAAGAWDVQPLSQFQLGPGAPANLTTPGFKVTGAFFAYGVGMIINMSGATQASVQSLVQKAQSSSGSVSFLGYTVGSASETSTSTVSWSTFNQGFTGAQAVIPPQDNAYPTLMAVQTTLIK